MNHFVAIESIVANALIEIMNSGKKPSVSFETVVRYGEKAAEQFERMTGDELTILASRKYQYSMIDSYPEYFEIEYSAPGHCIIHLKDESLKKRIEGSFRWSMRTDYVKAFLSAEALGELDE